MTDKELIKQEIEYLLSRGKYSINSKQALEDIIVFIDSLPEEPASEDLEKEIDKYFNGWTTDEDIGVVCHYQYVTLNDCKAIARHFAEWQKQKDKQLVGATQKISHQHGYDEGRVDMREEMMKDAVEGEVVYKIVSSIIAPTDIRYKVMSDKVYIPNVKLGDKVKIIIVNEEQQ